MPQEKHIEIYMDILSVIVFVKNLVFHDISNHIDTQDFIIYEIALQIRKLKSSM
jgi:hypothetical protein